MAFEHRDGTQRMDLKAMHDSSYAYATVETQ